MNYAFVCLDATGSMRGNENRVVSSMNEYVVGLPKDTMLAVFLFDSDRWDTHFNGPVRTWKPMEVEDYKTGALTPLFDSISKTIKYAENNTLKNDKVFVMIDTDGMENASKEETLESVKTLVDRKKKDGWEFWFMGTGIDQMSAEHIGQTGHQLGMNVDAVTHRNRRTTYSGANVGRTMSYFQR